MVLDLDISTAKIGVFGLPVHPFQMEIEARNADDDDRSSTIPSFAIVVNSSLLLHYRKRPGGAAGPPPESTGRVRPVRLPGP
jgi:hypothetical protein